MPRCFDHCLRLTLIPNVAPTLEALRAVTGGVHRQLERQLDVVSGLADPMRRADLIWRFAAFQLPAERALASFVINVEGLSWAGRSRAALFPADVRDHASLPAFPVPDHRAAALGMLYVLEGSTLGGQLIIRALRNAGVNVESLAFLNPYGPETGAQWQRFLGVLERETTTRQQRADACGGAVVAFEHAQSVLCGNLK